MKLATWLISLLGVAALLAAAGVSTSVPAADLPFLLAAAFLPFLAGLSFADKKDGEEEEEDERSRTIVAMPAWMSEELQKEREKLALDTTRTLAFDPSEAIKAARDAGMARDGGKKPEQEASAKAALSAEGNAGTSRTLMFDPKAAAAVREEATQPESEAASDQTASYSAEELKRLRESLQNTRDEDDGNARTVAYMPAVSQPQAPPLPKEEGDAFAATVAYMPAVTGTENGTLAYGPGDKERLLQAMGRKPAGPEEVDDGSAATQVYSKEQAAAVKDAYSLLESSRKPEATPQSAGAPAAQAPAPHAPAARPAAPPTSSATASSTTSPGSFSAAPMATASTAPAAVSTSPTGVSGRPSTKVSTFPEEGQKTGMSTGALITLLIVLLALAGGATAVILHLLGVVDLPLPLPQLDLFSK